eukprot:s2905_g5.t1
MPGCSGPLPAAKTCPHWARILSLIVLMHSAAISRSLFCLAPALVQASMAEDYPATSYPAAPAAAPAARPRSTPGPGHDGAILLPAVPELVDLEDLSDAQNPGGIYFVDPPGGLGEDLLAILRRCSAGFLARLARLIGRILRPVPQVITCHLPCTNPECNEVCGRVVDVIAAERTVWANNIATLLRDEKWSLPDAVTEITGQPFRLFLLDALLAIVGDPDRPFVDLLVEGVPLGVDSSMPPCPTLFPPAPQAPPSMELAHCSSSWGSALSGQASVDALLSKRCPKAGSARSLEACPSFKSDMLRPPLASWDWLSPLADPTDLWLTAASPG